MRRVVYGFGSDVYEVLDLYTGHVDDETMTQLETARDHQDAQVRIYRTLPEQYHQINTGDRVTLSRKYAQQHAAALRRQRSY